ncbi:MAG: hypothetical protein ACRCTR_09740 [Actinomycetota bacterium]
MDEVEFAGLFVGLAEEFRRDGADVRSRVGGYAYTYKQEWVGEYASSSMWRDGVHYPGESPGGVSLSDYFDVAYRVLGRRPVSVTVEVDETGLPGVPVLNFDLPPDDMSLREPERSWRELVSWPRPAGLVPGWMKVELAAVGAWDLVGDKLVMRDHHPGMQPHTPGSVGVPVPSGGELALSLEQIRELYSGPVFPDEITSWWPLLRKSWATPDPSAVIPGSALAGVRARWDVLAERFPGFVRVLTLEEQVAGAGPGDLVGIAPAFVEIAGVMPGVDVGVPVGWGQGEHQSWPALERDRFGQQPLLDGQRAGLVARVEPETGEPGDVAYTKGEAYYNLDGELELDSWNVSDVFVVAPDVVTFWEDFTTWAESVVPEAVAEIISATGDPEEQRDALIDYMDYGIEDWLTGVT